MIVNLNTARIFIRPGSTDLRKAVNGLAALVQQEMKLDPFSGSVYLFCNRDRRLLKALYWDKTGFWLCQKRLEQETFPWPQNSGETKELTAQQLHMLLAGIDFFKAHKELCYKKVA